MSYLSIRQAVSTAPLAGPKVWIEAMAYSLHVGTKRHAGGSNGEMKALYP
jgi:hypothetical protein